MLNKNELIKQEIRRLMTMVNCSTGEDKNDYKAMVKSIMDTLLKKDWALMDECQAIIDDMNKS